MKDGTCLCLQNFRLAGSQKLIVTNTYQDQKTLSTVQVMEIYVKFQEVPTVTKQKKENMSYKYNFQR